MVSVPFAFIIFSVCLAGSSYVSYRLGRTSGAEDVLEYLEAEGIITINYEDDEQ